MLDFESVLNGAIPAVKPLDVQRLWSFQAQHPQEPGQAISFSMEAISQICESDSDPIAVWARAAFLNMLVKHGLLEKWREEGGLRKAVFEAAAVFPLPNGLQGADFEEFITALPA